MCGLMGDVADVGELDSAPHLVVPASLLLMYAYRLSLIVVPFIT